MKKALYILFFLFFTLLNASRACNCSILSTVTYQYQTADFVASVKILKNYKNTPESNEYYKSDIEIIELYKGKKVKRISVLGSNGNNMYNSCGTFINVGEIRLIFGNLEKDGSISTYLCTSYYKPLSVGYEDNKVAQKLRLLKAAAKNHRISVSNDAALYPYDFKQIYDPELANNYSIVKVKLDHEGKPLLIKSLTKEQQKLIKHYKTYFTNEVDWKGRLNRIKVKSGKGITLFFEINPYTNTKPKN